MGPYTWKIEFPNGVVVLESRKFNPNGISGAKRISLLPKSSHYPLVEVDIPRDATTFCATSRIKFINSQKTLNTIYKIGFILEGRRYCLCVDESEKKIWKETK